MQWCSGTDIGFELSQENGIILRVRYVSTEVSYSAMPASRFEMVVEPSEQNLVWSEPKEIVDSFVFFTKTEKLWVELYIDLCEETASDDLPDETEDEMLSALCEIGGTDIDNGASNTLRTSNDNVIVLCDLESIQRLLRGWFIKNTEIDSVWDRIIDEFAENEAVLAVIVQLHSIRWNWISVCKIWVMLEHLVYMIREFALFVLIYCMRHICI